ncbi:tripartite tricarboxylate transporter permease [Acuticoccus sp.]|uniref:tripartite tricarboxylate transporter permease n=1 Tax=Acuticoccus sp. TaxID=1904378 RepID=UPI003B52DE5A
MIEGALLVLSPSGIFAAISGVVLGIVFGAIPGLTATLGIALLLPVTFLMAPQEGMIMLSGVYAGAIFGGSISAILLNTPGTPASIVTAWEGHAMARRGEAPEALGIAAVASGIGGLFSAVVMLLATAPLARIALEFGPAEFVALVTFSLVVVSVMLPTPLLANAAGCAIGLALATVGLDPVTGEARFTYGAFQLFGGLDLVALLIGFFCMTQGLLLAKEAILDMRRPAVVFSDASHISVVARTLGKRVWTLVRSSVIGTFLGILPAIGPETTPLIAHAVERRFARGGEAFGEGSRQGLAAAECSMNANVGGSLIPLLALGIPGSGAAAVFAGALILHGLRPGPLLFMEQPTIIYAFFTGFIFVNIFIILLGLYGARYFAVALRVPKGVLGALVCFFSIFGTYALGNSLFNVWVMFGATLFAFALSAVSIPILPVVLGLILGGLLEQNLVILASITRERSDLLTHPVAIGIFAITVAVLAIALARRLRPSPQDSTPP